MKQTTLKVILDTADRVKVDRVKDRIAWAINKLNNKVIFDIQDENDKNLREYAHKLILELEEIK